MKKTIATIALAGVIGLTSAMPAMASAPMYPGRADICAVVSKATLAVGEAFRFNAVKDNNPGVAGTCFRPGESITISIERNGNAQATGSGSAGGAAAAVPTEVIAPFAPVTSTTTADANGEFSVDLTLNEVGRYTLTASGVSGTYSTNVVVVPAAAANGLANSGRTAGAPLANTGADSNLVLWSLVGAGALAAGATSVVVVRRRAKAETAV
ncbi:LPXTG-motif cell wall-anchored protein [Arthrobacter sp. UYEF6]